MSLIKYNHNLPANFFRFFDDHATQARQMGAHRPAVNITEADDKFTLDVVAPGRHKDHFKVELNDEVLTIAYEAEKQDRPELLRREFTLGNFERTFKLNAKVIDGEAIEAVYEDGILSLTLPKLEEAVAKGPQRIAIA